MNSNDFFVAIQGVLMQAQEQGWSVDYIRGLAENAIEEWLVENEINGEGDYE